METFPQAFGRYRLTERLALGGMAELFLAEVAGAHDFSKTVVIKRILPHLAADKEFTKMFVSEAKITAKLDHPKIAQTFELGTEGKQLFIVMEYIDGFDVLALLRECAHRKVRVPAEISVYILKEVLDALDFAHKLRGDDDANLGIVHRDVSPSNILLSKRGDVKLVDFGIAHAATDGQTNSGTLKGKYGYMSPEQVLGESVTPKSDIFAAGVVLAEMLMGRRLFAAPNELDVLLMVRDVNLSRLDRFGSHIDPNLQSLLRWALRKDPSDRYKDALAMRDALDEWLFENRHRVTGSHVAEIVNSLYSDAVERRKQGLAASAKDIPSMGKAGTALKAETVEAHGKDKAAEVDAQGVPLGLAEVADRDVSDEPSSVITVEELGEPPATAPSKREYLGDIELSLGEESKEIQVHFAEEPSEPKAAEEASDDEIDIDLGDLADEAGGDEGLGAKGIGETSDEIDFSSLTLEGDEDEPARTPSKSAPTRAASPDAVDLAFDSISAAVASVSDKEKDPSAIDYDGSDVSGVRSLPETPGETESPSPARAASEGKDVSPDGVLTESGKVGDTSVLGLLYSYTARRATGHLSISSGSVKKDVYFKRGVPEYVASNVASELFGAYLVREEVVTSGELDMALAVMPHFGGKLGDTLVGLGLMKPLEVFRHLSRQVRKKLVDLSTWTKGSYEYFDGAVFPKQAFPLDLDPLEVYGAGAMATPRDTIVNWLLTRSDQKPTAARSSVVVPELFLVSHLRQWQESFDGSRSVAEIISECGDDEQGNGQLRALYLLMNTKLVEDAREVSK